MVQGLGLQGLQFRGLGLGRFREGDGRWLLVCAAGSALMARSTVYTLCAVLPAILKLLILFIQNP